MIASLKSLFSKMRGRTAGAVVGSVLAGAAMSAADSAQAHDHYSFGPGDRDVSQPQRDRFAPGFWHIMAPYDGSQVLGGPIHLGTLQRAERLASEELGRPVRFCRVRDRSGNWKVNFINCHDHAVSGGNPWGLSMRDPERGIADNSALFAMIFPSRFDRSLTKYLRQAEEQIVAELVQRGRRVEVATGHPINLLPVHARTPRNDTVVAAATPRRTVTQMLDIKTDEAGAAYIERNGMRYALMKTADGRTLVADNGRGLRFRVTGRGANETQDRVYFRPNNVPAAETLVAYNGTPVAPERATVLVASERSEAAEIVTASIAGDVQTQFAASATVRNGQHYAEVRTQDGSRIHIAKGWRNAAGDLMAFRVVERGGRTQYLPFDLRQMPALRTAAPRLVASV